MKINMIFKRLLALSLCFTLFFSVKFETCAEESGSGDLVILQKALVNKLEYDSDWLDVNSDNGFDIIDLIRMKKYLAGEDVEIAAIKYIDVTFVSGNNQTVQRLYTAQCRLPDLESPYLYWKIGNNYYNANSVHSFSVNTVITAVESKKDIDFPIIDF